MNLLVEVQDMVLHLRPQPDPFNGALVVYASPDIYELFRRRKARGSDTMPATSAWTMGPWFCVRHDLGRERAVGINRDGKVCWTVTPR